jgi:hypothetical protein
MYYKHRYNLIRFDLSTSGTAYKLFIKSLYDYIIVKEVTVSDVTTRSYFIGAKDLEANWTNKTLLTYSTDIKGRKLVNEGQNWLAAAGQITELLTGVNYRVEDYPLVWIEDTYYTTYKDDIFQVSVKTDVPTQAEYDAVTSILLISQNLTTDFTGTFLNKFRNLSILSCGLNQISVLDVSQLVNLISLTCDSNQITTLDVSQLTSLSRLFCYNNQITTLDVSQLVNLGFIRCQDNQLDAAENSQILIDLDTNGLSNGYFESSIFGGGSLTAAGQTAKSNLLSKGWTIIGT